MRSTSAASVLAAVLMAGCSGSPPQSGSPPPPSQSAVVPAPAPPPPVMVRQKAEVGVGKKGQGYGVGPVSTPISAYFRTQQRIAFDIQLVSALQLYKAEHGSAPKTQEEFMEKIVKANQIQLPELPQGHRYVYDPQQEQLMVERPAEP